MQSRLFKRIARRSAVSIKSKGKNTSQASWLINGNSRIEPIVKLAGFIKRVNIARHRPDEKEKNPYKDLAADAARASTTFPLQLR